MGVVREGYLLRWACFLVADNAGVVREGHLKKGQVGGSCPHCCQLLLPGPRMVFVAARDRLAALPVSEEVAVGTSGQNAHTAVRVPAARDHHDFAGDLASTPDAWHGMQDLQMCP